MVHDDGSGDKLYVAGRFDKAGGTSAANIACWNGTAWSPAGGGLDGTVITLLAHDDGTGMTIYAGGNFTVPYGQGHNVARWDGRDWRTVGEGIEGPSVNALAVFDDNALNPALYAGGFLFATDGIPLRGLARWDGHQWGKPPGDLQASLTLPEIGALAVTADGESLVVGGSFDSIDGMPAANIASFDGKTWTPMADGLVPQSPGWTPCIRALLAEATLRQGAAGVVAAGYFWNTDLGISGIAQWTGDTWAPLGGGLGPVGFPTVGAALIVHDDGTGAALYIGGIFESAGPVPARNIGRWDGNAWSAVGVGLEGPDSPAGISALCIYRGELYAGGNFTNAGNVPAFGIARWGRLLGDLDCDGVVGQTDFGLLLLGYGCIDGPCTGDLNGDGRTDQGDLGLLLGAFGTHCGQ
jgi:hypothetical protein